MTATFPFSAIVGNEDLKRALLLNVVEPRIGGVLIRGDRGTAKTTLVRALAAGTCTVRATKAGNAFYATATATMSRTVYEPARVVGNPAIRQSGDTVLGGSGSWSFGSPRAVLSFQWYRCGGYASSTCSPIAGATRANLSIAPDLRGAYVQLRVTATQLGGVARTTSQSGVLRLSSR